MRDEARAADRRLQTRLDESDFSMGFSTDDDSVCLRQDRRREDIKVDVDQVLLIHIAGTAESDQARYRLFQVDTVAVDWDGYSSDFTEILPRNVYCIHTARLREAADAVREALLASAAARWGDGFAIEMRVTPEVCAAISVEHDGRTYRDWMRYDGASSGARPTTSRLQSSRADVEPCLRTATGITDVNVFRYGYEHGLYLVEDLSEFLRSFLLSQDDFDRLDLDYLRKDR